MVEVLSTSETFADFYQLKQRNITEDSHLLTRLHENLKLHLLFDLFNPHLQLFNEVLREKHTKLGYCYQFICQGKAYKGF